MDWNKLKLQTAKALENSLVELFEAHPEENFYAIALYTDSSAMTVGFAANSLEALEAKINEEDEEDREECKNYYKWATSEWIYEDWGWQDFESICKCLRDAEERKNFEEFKLKVIALMTEALDSVSRSTVFESAGKAKPVMFVSVTDDNSAEGYENSSAKILNSSSVFNDFLSRYKSNMDGV